MVSWTTPCHNDIDINNIGSFRPNSLNNLNNTNNIIKSLTTPCHDDINFNDVGFQD